MHSAIVLVLNIVTRCAVAEHCLRQVLLPSLRQLEWSGVEWNDRVE